MYALLEDDMKQGERMYCQYNKEIDATMEEVKRGEMYSHDQVVKLSEKW